MQYRVYCGSSQIAYPPLLVILPELTDLIGRTRLYVPSWVRQFYASLYVDPHHNFIHFAFRGRDYRMMSREGQRDTEVIGAACQVT